MFSKLNDEFLDFVKTKYYGGWAYYAQTDDVKKQFFEWVKANYPEKYENVESLWACFSYEYSAFITM